MSTELGHTPAQIVGKLLWANRALGTDPTWWETHRAEDLTEALVAAGTYSWPVFQGEPDEPDECITVRPAADELAVRILLTGEEVYRRGVTIRVRGRSEAAAWVKAEAIRFDLTVRAFDQTVALDGITYLIVGFTRAPVVPFGRHDSKPDLWLANVNALASIQRLPLQGAV